MANFFDCVRTRKSPAADIETGHRSVTLCHLGVIAMRLARPLRWEPGFPLRKTPTASKRHRLLGRECIVKTKAP